MTASVINGNEEQNSVRCDLFYQRNKISVYRWLNKIFVYLCSDISQD